MESGGKFDATHAPGRGLELDKVCVWSTANLSPPGFFLGKVLTAYMRYMGWMHVLVRVFVYFSKTYIVHVGKSKVTATKEQRTAQAGCTTTTTERRAHRTAHFTAARNPAACIYFIAFRGMRFMWLARHK